MRRTLLLLSLLIAVALPSTTVARAGGGSQVVLDKTFMLDPNDARGMVYDCFEAPYGSVMTVVAMTLDEDTGDERVSLVLKEGDFTRLRTSLSTNPTVMASYAGAGTYCYWIGASHVHLDTIAPVRQARLTITADSDVGR